MDIAFPARFTIRIIGPMPGAGFPSITTLSVAVHAWPAFGATGAPIMLMFRSFATAAGAAARAARTARTLSFRIVPPCRAVYTGRPDQVPQAALEGQRRRIDARPRAISTSAEAALFAYERSRSTRSGFARWTSTNR